MRYDKYFRFWQTCHNITREFPFYDLLQFLSTTSTYDLIVYPMIMTKVGRRSTTLDQFFFNDFNLDFFRLTFFTPINRNMLK